MSYFGYNKGGVLQPRIFVSAGNQGRFSNPGY